MDYDDPIVEYEDPIVEERHDDHGRGGCLNFLSILIIVTMIGVSLPSLFWLFSLRERPSPAIVRVTVEVTATPSPTATAVSVAEGEVTVENTAVPTPAFENEDGTINRIAFIDNEGQVITIRSDGTDVQAVTRTLQRFQYPAWSPDSSQIAAIGQDRTGGAVYVMEATAQDSQPDSLYFDDNDNPFYLYWSPNGEQIGFIANNRLAGIALHVVPADGASDSRVVSTGAPFYWQWAADSEQMLVHVGGSGRQGRVEMIEVGDGNALNDLGSPGFFQSPGISANGRYWAFAERTGLDSRVAVVDTSSDGKQVEAHAGVVAMSWSPTDPLLAYISSELPESESFIGPLRVMDAETGEVTLLSGDDVVGFFWSPNGRYIAALSYLSMGFERDINVQRGKSPLAKPSAQFDLPQLELVIFDVTTMEGKELMRFVPTFSFLSQMLPFFDQYALSHQIWSPKSDALVLPMLEDNIDKVVVVSLESGENQVITEGDMPFWSLR